MHIEKGDLQVEWEYLGEGYSGDYDRDYQYDEELMRFSFYRLVDGEWVFCDDMSYCTFTPLDTPEDVLLRLLGIIMDRVSQEDDERAQVRVCEEMSFISPEWLKN